MSTNEDNLTKFFNLAVKNHRENKLQEAEKFYNQVLKINSYHFYSVFYLASLYAQTQNFTKSKELFKKSIHIQPNQALSHSNLGAVLKELGNFEEAAEACKKAIAIEPNNVAALGNLALTLIELGQISEAIDCYKKLNSIKSNPVSYYRNLGHLNIVLDDKKEAINSYEMAIKHEPDDLSNYYYLSSLNNKILNKQLKKKINQIVLKSKNNKNLSYANLLLSKYESNIKNYEKEFNYLLKGHSCFLTSEKKNYKNDIKYWLNVLPNNKELDKAKIEIKEKNRQSLRPIFIVGVPRCGSTLVEKIISSGPQKVATGEEIHILSLFVKKKIIKKEPIFLDDKSFEINLIKKYKERRLIQEKSNFIFTDKTLDNFFYIGLIKKIFPNAKVINCKRSPLSSIMSILKNNLPAIPWAHSLEDIFNYFDIYNKSISKSEKSYPGFVYSLDYEKLVVDPEAESKKLMDFCNLPWDKKCLDFYKRKDLISKTSSNIQVRKEIYTNSQKKYLPYKKLLNKHVLKYSWYK